MNALRTLENITKALYDNSFDHGLPHIERVLRWAYMIVEKEELEINEEILRLSVYLHDVGRIIGEPHSYYSMMIAEELLREAGYDNDYIDKVLNAIAYHSYSFRKNQEIKPLCEEAKVLSDADKIDALGVVGFIRVFLFSSKPSRSIEDVLNHFHEKILNLEKHMHYEFSKSISKVYTARTRLLLEMLKEELGPITINN